MSKAAAEQEREPYAATSNTLLRSHRPQESLQGGHEDDDGGQLLPDPWVRGSNGWEVDKHFGKTRIDHTGSEILSFYTISQFVSPQRKLLNLMGTP